ncbi:phenylalanine--tRNA ligase subunit beta [Candidatus Omnitrophota bacterium]
MKVSERWLRNYVSIKKSIEEIAQSLTMAGLEVKNLHYDKELDDTIFEVEITSNRPDWLSYLGIAREVAALYDVPVTYPSFDHQVERFSCNDFSITIKESSLCPFYAGVIIEGVEVKESPKEIQDKLCAVGLRPINIVVDLTNIVLFELGQPMHAFDLDLLKGRKIIVKSAKQGEKFTAINHEEYTLRKDDLMICDNEKSVAIAGVMGGLESEVTATTKNILLESAFFNPSSIRNTSRYHIISSDSSYRFERKVDLGMVRAAQDRFITLLKQYSTFARVSQVVCDGADSMSEMVIAFNLDEIPQTIGIEIDSGTVKNILEKLGLTVKDNSADSFKVSVPSFRPDLERPIDLLEEITRIYGYDKVPETLPPRIAQNDALEDKVGGIERRIKGACVASGCFEVVPFTLVNEEKFGDLSSVQNKFVRIVNPQHKDLRLLRPSLIPSMLEVVAANLNQGNLNLKLFEIGSAYLRTSKKDLPSETKTCCIVLVGETERKWYQHPSKYTLLDLKGIVENISEQVGCEFGFTKGQFDYYEVRCSYGITVKGKQCGHMGTLDSKLLNRYGVETEIFICELDVATISECALLEKTHKEISKFPVVKRDIAVIVEHDTLVQDVQNTIIEHADGLITHIALIDSFAGKHLPKGKKNIAFSMEFSRNDRTLSGEEIQRVYDDIFTSLNKKFKAEYRTV